MTECCTLAHIYKLPDPSQIQRNIAFLKISDIDLTVYTPFRIVQKQN